MDHVNYILVLLIGLLCCVAVVAGLARRFAVSYPIVLVIFGLVCSLLPRIPRIPLPPSLVFFVILPPLLYVAAWQTSWRDRRVWPGWQRSREGVAWVDDEPPAAGNTPAGAGGAEPLAGKWKNRG